MKKIVLLSLIVLIGVFVLTGCENISKKTVDGKTYNINGISVKLDKSDERDGMKYKTSSSFEKDYKSTTTTYTSYIDKNKDKHDLSNIKFRLDVTVDIMNLESRIEKEKKLITSKDNFKNVKQDQKVIDEITWDYFTFDNAYENTSFKEHLYLTERKMNNYYYVYKVYFSYAEDIEEFEEAFMNNVKFE